MSPARSWLSVMVLAGGCATSALALEWKTQVLSFTTAPFQATQEATFDFANKGPQPVTIREVETSCDCLDAAADRQTYAPGTAGKIKVRLTVGDRLGLYERFITVVTDEGGDPVRLQVRLEVPEIMRLTPRSVAWELKGPAHEQTIEVEAAPGLEITLHDLQATSDAFATRLEVVEPGRRYRVHVRPLSTAQPVNAALRLLGRAKTGQSVVFSAYANVL